MNVQTLFGGLTALFIVSAIVSLITALVCAIEASEKRQRNSHWRWLLLLSFGFGLVACVTGAFA